jgi:hypothetical protein
MLDITAMARMRKHKLSPNRLNRFRIESSTRLDNPERDRLFRLADRGMPLLLRPGFIPNGAGPHPPRRRKYVSVSSAVNRQLFEIFHQKGLAFILTKETATTIPGLHLSPLSWTEKQGKVEGRPIGDNSDGGYELNNEPLNSDHTKLESDELWGQIKHPTLKDICLLIDNFCIAEAKADSAFKDEDIVLIKLDLQQAFTLVDFEANGVKHFSFFHCLNYDEEHQLSLNSVMDIDRLPSNLLRKRLYKHLFHETDIGLLEKLERRKLPNCAVARVRQIYPNTEGQYKGYREN